MDGDDKNCRGGLVPVGQGAGRTLKGGRTKQRNDTAREKSFQQRNQKLQSRNLKFVLTKFSILRLFSTL